MQTVAIAALQYVLSLQFLQGYRTTLGAIGLIGAGLGKIFGDPADISSGVGLIFGALAMIGVRHQDQPDSNVVSKFKLWMTKH